MGHFASYSIFFTLSTCVLWNSDSFTLVEFFTSQQTPLLTNLQQKANISESVYLCGTPSPPGANEDGYETPKLHSLFRRPPCFLFPLFFPGSIFFFFLWMCLFLLCITVRTFIPLVLYSLFLYFYHLFTILLLFFFIVATIHNFLFWCYFYVLVYIPSVAIYSVKFHFYSFFTSSLITHSPVFFHSHPSIS